MINKKYLKNLISKEINGKRRTEITLLKNISNLTYEKIIVKYIFITLACLTLPHLLLNIFYENKLNYK